MTDSELGTLSERLGEAAPRGVLVDVRVGTPSGDDVIASDGSLSVKIA